MIKKLALTVGIFFLLLAILGYLSMREIARMEVFQAKRVAEKIEQGARVYAENCAWCHGEQGKAEECIIDEGRVIACGGRALNTPQLLCNDKSQRLYEVGWSGTTEEYIRTITTVGNTENGMPAFGIDYRYDTFTALSNQQIEDVTAYVLNFESDLMHSCAPIPTPAITGDLLKVSNLPTGDPIMGEELYNITYGCAACHGDLEVEGSNVVAPWSGNWNNLDGVLEGYLAADYVYESILNPNAHIAPECPIGPCQGPPSAMPETYGLRMTYQDIADVMAYVGLDTQNSSGVEINVIQE